MIKAIVTDIEGTTSAISFVKDVLFPYARANIADFLQQQAANPEVQTLLNDARTLVGKNLSQEELTEQLIAWIDTDQKVTPLKALQGLMWADGYYNGKLTGHIYPDVIPQLKHWQAEGLKLYVYSSGSVFAQKLLFAHTSAGDMTPLFSGYFDTHVGAKQEVASYKHIAEHIGLPANNILFLSDITAELDAAKAAGFSTCCLCREGIMEASTTHPQATNFDEITVDY